MAEYTIDKIKYGDNTYILQDSVAEETIGTLADNLLALIPADASVTTANNQHTVTMLNSNTPTPDELFNFNIPASSGSSVSPSTITPSMDGTATIGTATAYARADHVHPTDTSRASVVHTHVATDITSGILSQARGGTGNSSFEAAMDTIFTNLEEDTGDDTEQVLTHTYEQGFNIVPLSDLFSYDGDSYYCTSSTTAANAAKTVACSVSYELKSGNTITILFSTANIAAAPTLNINSTGAKSVYVNNAVASSTNPCK